MDLLSTTSSI
jgi:transcriptional activator Myb